MINKGKRCVLGVGISVVDYDGALTEILDAAKSHTALGAAALAVHGVMTGALNPTHKYRLNRLGLVTPDGQPVRWALHLLHGERLPDRVYGPNLTQKLCARAAEEQLSIYLYGSRREVLDAWIENLKAQFPSLKIAGAEPSKFRLLTANEDADLNTRILASGADIVFVGLGCPRQEIFVHEHAGALSCPVLAVGAAFDFHAGLLKQAPLWMQDRGLEWVFRLSMEPKRLWRRYIFLNPMFCLMVAAQKLGLMESRRQHEEAPAQAVRYG